MKVVADKNITLVTDAFSQFGPIITVPGREIRKEVLRDASMLLVRSVTPVNSELLEGTAIKFVASATIGTDHIDTEYLKSKNIGFAYAPGSNSDSVAQYTITAIISIAHKMNRSLDELSLGIIGVGNIGSKVQRLAEVLGIRCLLNDPPKKRATGSEMFVSLEEMLPKADILTLHVPLITTGPDTTFHLVNQPFIAAMKRNASLINTSRGKAIDERSIRAGREKLGYVVLDVWENEPAISLETLEIVNIATPHIAGYSFEGKIKGTQMIYNAACSFFSANRLWEIPSVYFSETADEINIRESISPLFDAVTSAYPIELDYHRLKGISGRNRAERMSYFDELRNTYPRRREFGHFLVRCTKQQGKEKELLLRLGFRIK